MPPSTIEFTESHVHSALDQPEVPFSRREDKVNPWEKCTELASDFDNKYCDTLKDELDNLLVFAALFSGILAAFTIESYKWLQPNAQDPPVSFKDAIVINNLWFASLATSLGVTSLGILCMQWIRMYRQQEMKPTKSSVILRRRKFQGLVQWHVPTIISLLPVLLQLALLAFVIGLTYLLWALSIRVALVFTTLSILFISMVLFTTVAPILQWWLRQITPMNLSQCPYQSPQGWIFFLISWWFTSTGRYLASVFSLQKPVEHHCPVNWKEFDETWRSPDEKKHDEQLLIEEFLWLEDNFGHDVEGIKSRAIALGDLPVGIHRNIVHRVVSNLELEGVEGALADLEHTSSSGEAELALIQTWYFTAYAHVHPVLDVDCMAAKVRWITRQQKGSATLPETPMRNGLNMDSLVNDPQLISQFLHCLKAVVEDKGLTEANQREMWLLINGLFEYALQENEYPAFNAMKRLFDALFKHAHSLGDSLDARAHFHSPRPPPPFVRVVKQLVEGLQPFVDLYGDEKFLPLPEQEARRVKPLLYLINTLEKEMRALAQETHPDDRDSEKFEDEPHDNPYPDPNSTATLILGPLLSNLIDRLQALKGALKGFAQLGQGRKGQPIDVPSAPPSPTIEHEHYTISIRAPTTSSVSPSPSVESFFPPAESSLFTQQTLSHRQSGSSFSFLRSPPLKTKSVT